MDRYRQLLCHLNLFASSAFNLIYADTDIMLLGKIIGIMLIVRFQASIGPYMLRRIQWEHPADSLGNLSYRGKSWYKQDADTKAKELSRVILFPFKMC